MPGRNHTTLVGILVIFMSLTIFVESHPGKQMLQDEMFGQMSKRRGNLDTREIADKMLQQMMEVVRNLYRDLGASDQELHEVDRKRSAIMACYFQAVSCY